MFKLTDEQIEKAANWWADRVCTPTFSGLSPEERKDTRNASYQLAEMLAAMQTEPIDSNTRQNFIDALKEQLASESFNPYQGLSVDYHPDRVLAFAAGKSGGPMSNFPWKTFMRFEEDGTVIAACGYGTVAQPI